MKRVLSLSSFFMFSFAVALAYGMGGQGAGTGQGGPGQGNFLVSLAPLLVIFVIFYLLMIRPQQKQQKKFREMLGNLKKGDAVLTKGGIYGTIHGLAENIITIDVGNDVKIKFSRDSIATIVSNETKGE